MALVPMFTGYLLFGWALAHVPATTATTLTLLEPAVATLLAVTIVGEHLPAAGWAGLALIAGCLVILTAPPRLRRPGMSGLTFQRREGSEWQAWRAESS
jgi:DME family drug/metabolite transporter